jgi:type IV secretion system protein VirB4
MLALHEYRRRADRLADHLPWAALVADGVILNKDGSFQRSFAFRGPDLQSATDTELVATSARVNNILKRLGTGWALHIEAERRPAVGYPASIFPDPASWLVDEERRALFARARHHFESHFYMTLTWLPAPDSADAAGRSLIDRPDEEKVRDWRAALSSFLTETGRIQDLLATVFPAVHPLRSAETLTYLHGTISDRVHPVEVPETPLYLDALLVDTPLIGGLEPRLGRYHLRTLSVLGFPALSRPGLLDALNAAGFSYRWVTRFITLDKSDATKLLSKLRRQWFNKRKSLTALLREVMYSEPTQLLDSDADNKVSDADLALQALGGDHVAFGYLTTTITVADEDRGAVDDKLRGLERILGGLGMVTLREGANALEAWLSSIPGQVYANVRQPIVHTLNLAHLMPISSVWAGPERNAHLDGPALLYAETAGTTPFRLSTHVGDVGHMMVVGPTGAGKSVLLALLALQFRRYEDAQIFIFDKGFSARAAVLAMGGTHYPLGATAIDDTHVAFQPLRDIDSAAERAWAAEWLAALFEAEKVALTPDVKDAIWSALGSLASAPVNERTMTGLSLLLQSRLLRSAIQPYTLDGPYGQLFDAADNRLDLSRVQCFETEALMHKAGAVAPLLSYLFHRLEDRFDGRPTLLILDEAWVFLDHPLFAARLREWLKTLRKKNVAVVFATQSLADIAESKIAPAIIESCPQRILLPNDRAAEPIAREAYARFGLNDRQIELVAHATPKRHYYLQSTRGHRLFELGLGPIALALCGASDPESQTCINRIIAAHNPREFAAQFFAQKDLGWAADQIAHFPFHLQNPESMA